jgi:hypothetical protein
MYTNSDHMACLMGRRLQIEQGDIVTYLDVIDTCNSCVTCLVSFVRQWVNLGVEKDISSG